MAKGDYGEKTPSNPKQHEKKHIDFFFSKNPDQKPHRFFPPKKPCPKATYFFFLFTENSISYLAQLSTLRCVCFSQLPVERVLFVAFRDRSLHCGGINRDSFSMHGLNSQEICQELGGDREARQVWGAALEAISKIPSSWRNPFFLHIAHVRVETCLQLPDQCDKEKTKPPLVYWCAVCLFICHTEGRIMWKVQLLLTSFPQLVRTGDNQHLPHRPGL